MSFVPGFWPGNYPLTDWAQERHWVWRPGETVRPCDCTWGN